MISEIDIYLSSSMVNIKYYRLLSIIGLSINYVWGEWRFGVWTSLSVDKGEKNDGRKELELLGEAYIFGSIKEG